MSFPETVDEILDVSEDEGEGPELDLTIPEICQLSQCDRQQPWGWALAFLPAGVGELCGPTVVLRREQGESTRLLGWHLLAWVVSCTMQEGYAWTSPWSHAPGTVCREPLGMQSPHRALLHGVVPAPSLAAAGLLLLPPTKTSPLPLLTLQALLMSQ